MPFLVRPLRILRGTNFRVSMPFNGLHPFLPQMRHKREENQRLCQCPLTGYMYFYSDILTTDTEIEVMCQCPLTGYMYFYVYPEDGIDLQTAMCQCPLTGYMYFYKMIQIFLLHPHVCQCPLTGYMYFYPALLEAPVYKALKGAISPRFFKLLQKCYILPFFCFYKILLLICVLFYHIFLINARTFLTILFRRVKRINGI